MITKEQVMKLSHGNIIYHISNKNSDGTPQRWRVTSKIKTWKRDPERFRFAVKHGLFTYDEITEKEAHLVCLTEEEVKKDHINESNLEI